MAVQKATKKPVTVEFVTFENEASLQEIREFCGNMYVGSYTDRKTNTTKVDINTLEGVISASIGDKIIKGVKGEFYPCKPDIFASTYDVEGDSVE